MRPYADLPTGSPALLGLGRSGCHGACLETGKRRASLHLRLKAMLRGRRSSGPSCRATDGPLGGRSLAGVACRVGRTGWVRVSGAMRAWVPEQRRRTTRCTWRAAVACWVPPAG